MVRLRGTLPMTTRRSNGARRISEALAGLAVLLGLTGCRASQAPARPTIDFTRVPAADKGGPDTLDTIEGRVTGARPGQQIVVFSHSGVWWVQLGPRDPFTPIQSDSSWTHHTLQFSGYEWIVRAAPSDRGGPNEYDPANAWTDERGALHLRIARRAGDWTCAEISLTRRLGYGSYRFVVRDVSHLGPAAVLSMFTWDGVAAEANHREVSIEISRWGDRGAKNARYVVQPYYVSANVAPFFAPAGVLTHLLRWEPGRATLRTVRGPGARGDAPVIAEHVFTSGVPSPGDERVRINCYVFRRGAEMQRDVGRNRAGGSSPEERRCS